MPPKQSTHHPGSGGSVQVVKEEKNDDGMSFIDRVLQEDDQAAAAQAQLAASPQFAVPMYPGKPLHKPEVRHCHDDCFAPGSPEKNSPA